MAIAARVTAWHTRKIVSLAPAEDPVRKIQVALPVVERQIMLSLTDVVVDAVAVEGSSDLRHHRRAQRPAAEESVDGASVNDGEELPTRVGPEVLLGAPHGDSSGGDERNQHVLINRQRVLPAVVSLVGLAEPVGEGRVDPGYRFFPLEPPPTQRCAGATGIIGYDKGEALILRAGPESGLPPARVADDSDLIAREASIGDRKSTR